MSWYWLAKFFLSTHFLPPPPTVPILLSFKTGKKGSRGEKPPIYTPKNYMCVSVRVLARARTHTHTPPHNDLDVP